VVCYELSRRVSPCALPEASSKTQHGTVASQEGNPAQGPHSASTQSVLWKTKNVCVRVSRKRIETAPEENRQGVVAWVQQRGHVERIVGDAPLELGDAPKRVVWVTEHIAVQGRAVISKPRNKTHATLHLGASW
jgi:hypothetical protein